MQLQQSTLYLMQIMQTLYVLSFSLLTQTLAQNASATFRVRPFLEVSCIIDYLEMF